MGYIKRKVIFLLTRFLIKRRWGRRLLWAFALRTVRSRARQFVREIVELYPALAPVIAWV